MSHTRAELEAMAAQAHIVRWLEQINVTLTRISESLERIAVLLDGQDPPAR